MLLDVAAFASSSSTLGTVAGAFAMPENLQLSQLGSVVASATLTPSQSALMQAMDLATSSRLAPASLTSATVTPPFAAVGVVPSPHIAPQPVITRVSASRLPSLRGADLLTQLGLLDRSELGDFVTQHPSSVSALITNPPAASTVAAIWADLTPATRAAWVAKAPQVVGSLEGFPYAERDAANRLYLSQSENQVRQQLKAGVGRAASDDLTKRLHMLQQVEDALKVGPSGNSRQLVTLDPTGGGRAVIVIGDVSTADYVDYLIPGMFSDVETQIAAFADSSDTIATQQQAWIARLNPDVPSAQLPTVATVAWIGYHTPSVVNVASMELAREGEQSLAASLAGLRTERAETGSQPYVAILAHSYGSTAAMLALQDDDVSVDALAIVGSPGSPARTAGALHVTDGNVWVGAAAADPVPQTGLFGSQPLSASYSAHQFGVNGAVDPVTGTAIRASVGHNDYFVDGTESLRNMVLIGIGRGDLVIGDDGRSALTGQALALGKGHATLSHPAGPQL